MSASSTRSRSVEFELTIIRPRQDVCRAKSPSKIESASSGASTSSQMELESTTSRKSKKAQHAFSRRESSIDRSTASSLLRSRNRTLVLVLTASSTSPTRRARHSSIRPDAASDPSVQAIGTRATFSAYAHLTNSRRRSYAALWPTQPGARRVSLSLAWLVLDHEDAERMARGISEDEKRFRRVTISVQ